MDPYRVALVGHPGSGKTTIAEEYLKLFGSDEAVVRKRLSFAETLKWEWAYALAAVQYLYDEGDGNIDSLAADIYHEMQDPATKEKHRAALQWWGTDFRRAQDPDYWVKKLLEEIDAYEEGAGYHHGHPMFVVDDCRFMNEHAALRERGFTFVYLEPGKTTIKVPRHSSEHDWPQFAFDLVLAYHPGPDRQAARLKRILEGEPLAADVSEVPLLSEEAARAIEAKARQGGKA